MTEQEIKDSKPSGATYYAEYENRIFYFIKSSYGFRQIKGNLIQFDDSNIDELIRPL